MRGSRGRSAAAAMVAAASLGLPGAAAAAGSVCDVHLDARMSVYKVMVGEEPFQDKRYLTWDDAIKLRDVLVSSGACARAAGPRPCTVELIAAGNYAVVRDGINFDPYAKLRTLEAARKYAGTLEKARLCKMAR